MWYVVISLQLTEVKVNQGDICSARVCLQLLASRVERELINGRVTSCERANKTVGCRITSRAGLRGTARALIPMPMPRERSNTPDKQ